MLKGHSWLKGCAACKMMFYWTCANGTLFAELMYCVRKMPYCTALKHVRLRWRCQYKTAADRDIRLWLQEQLDGYELGATLILSHLFYWLGNGQLKLLNIGLKSSLTGIVEVKVVLTWEFLSNRQVYKQLKMPDASSSSSLTGIQVLGVILTSKMPPYGPSASVDRDRWGTLLCWVASFLTTVQC